VGWQALKNTFLLCLSSTGFFLRAEVWRYVVAATVEIDPWVVVCVVVARFFSESFK
jgi:hypothetical protein